MPRPKGSLNKPQEEELKLMCMTDREWNDRIDQLSTKVDQLVEVVNALTDRVLSSEKKEELIIGNINSAVNSVPVTQPIRSVEEPMPTNDVPVPPSWVKKMQEILGVDFTMKIIESAGGDFIMDVFLPEHLKREKQMKGPDHSTGLIRRPSAIQDVETWCIKIRDNIKKYHPEFKN